MGLEEVVDQLKTNCLCFKEQETASLNVLARQLVDNISLSTCWTRNACETLLTSLRTERIEVPCVNVNDCCGNIQRFRPYYQANINESTLSVSLIVQSGLKTTITDLDKGHFSLTSVKGFSEILYTLDEYMDKCNCNSCDSFYLEFQYEAGYDKLPDCLLPELCEIAKTITASSLGCGDITECCELPQKELGYVLKSKRMGELSWSWDKDKDSIQYLYNQLVTANRFKALAMISLCGTSTDDYSSRLWAVNVKV